MVRLSDASCLTRPFEAMGGPCELVVDTDSRALADRLLILAQEETARLEAKYSRYRPESALQTLNRSAGHGPCEVDEETAALLDYADENFKLSNGLFDVTSGVLRHAWTFDGRAYDHAPSELEGIRARVGWSAVRWDHRAIALPAGYEIDLGGIVKEYAADKVLAKLRLETSMAVLVNLGGDLAAAGPRVWSVGIEAPDREGHTKRTIPLQNGGLATSGMTKRYVMIQGERHAHIVNPKTGWPIKNAPRSITVRAATCTEAGFWSTLGMLHEAGAEAFLDEHQLDHWCEW